MISHAVNSCHINSSTCTHERSRTVSHTTNSPDFSIVEYDFLYRSSKRIHPIEKVGLSIRLFSGPKIMNLNKRVEK